MLAIMLATPSAYAADKEKAFMLGLFLRPALEPAIHSLFDCDGCGRGGRYGGGDYGYRRHYDDNYYRNPGVTGAYYRGRSERLRREQRRLEDEAYRRGRW